jgi:hypothetical protein
MYIHILSALCTALQISHTKFYTYVRKHIFYDVIYLTTYIKTQYKGRLPGLGAAWSGRGRGGGVTLTGVQLKLLVCAALR